MIECSNVRFSYPGDGFSMSIQQLDIRHGEAVAIIGPSGAGKTTLLWLLAGILVPLSGSIRVNGRTLSAMADRDRRRFRISDVGMVFQDIELVEYLTVLDNILLPFRINPAQRLSAASSSATENLLVKTGLQGKSGRYPQALSQGEKQRVAMCRALVTSPGLVLADEPTSSLDTGTSDRILDILLGMVREKNSTLIMSTHNDAVLDRFDRVVDVVSLLADI